MKKTWQNGTALALTITSLVAFSAPAKALTFGEALGVGAATVIIDRAIQRGKVDESTRYVSPDREYYRGVEDGANGARYDNPRNSIDYDQGYQEGIRKRRG
jgi:hypothetical protein